MPTIKMTSTEFACVDGVRREKFKAGHVYEVPDNIYKDFMSLGCCEDADPIDAESKDLGGAPENKDMGAAPENKSEGGDDEEAKAMTIDQLKEHLQTLESAEEVEALAEGEERAGAIKAIEARLKELDADGD